MSWTPTGIEPMEQERERGRERERERERERMGYVIIKANLALIHVFELQWEEEQTDEQSTLVAV